MYEIEISAEGMSADDLLAESERLWVALENLGKLIDKVGQWFTESAALDEKARLWNQYAGLCRDYRVLMSWYNITFAAYVFAETGSELETVTVDGLQVTGAILTDR